MGQILDRDESREKEAERKNTLFTCWPDCDGENERSLQEDLVMRRFSVEQTPSKLLPDGCTTIRTATAGSDVVQSDRPIFDDFFQHLWPYIGNNTANVVFQMVKRLWLIGIPVHRTATAGSDVVQSGRPIFDDFFQHLWPYIGNNTANVVFQMVQAFVAYPHRRMTLHSFTENSLVVLNHTILEANSQVQNVKLGGHQTCLSINRLWHELCDMLRRFCWNHSSWTS
ncbi:uncharacterized protein TNCV_4373491 [Trichonephila clavipes]|uniref:Uncharacterized protein n=1 Tax=Trichonephila clavipes TaxID=2585209 RepID=A0A8X6UZS6_TRICX|nr:uncharacterized protein TNCV_4373491 [Trichonephila clavipes]